MENELYQMKLHEQRDIAGQSVIRVPGGWIYILYRGPVFVPFNMALAGERQAVIDKLLGHSTRRMAERYGLIRATGEKVQFFYERIEV